VSNERPAPEAAIYRDVALMSFTLESSVSEL